MGKPNDEREDMNEPNYLVKWLIPERAREYETWLVDNLAEKIKLVKEKAANGATAEEIEKAKGQAWKAVAMAKNYFKL